VNGGNFLGDPAAAAGDVNGDGRADVILNGAGANGGADLGAVVVFGRSSTGPVDVNALDGDGVSLTGAFHDSGDLRSVGTAGDMTGDGAADVVIGAPWPGNLGRAYVVSLLPSVSQRLAELRFQIASFGLPTSLRDRFFRRLDRIRFAYVGGNQPSACRRIQRLSAFAQRLNGTKLTAAQTFTIVAGAGRVGRAAGC
jgi:hypothetical protein